MDPGRALETYRRDTVKNWSLDMRMTSIFDAGTSSVVETDESGAANNGKKVDRKNTKQEHGSPSQPKKQCKIKVALRRCFGSVL